jgi:transcriptional regulator with XRE-family HTH domain
MSQDETFRERLRETLSEYDRLEVCKIIGYSIRSMTGWLSGESAPSIYAVRDMAVAMGVSVDWLLGLSLTPTEEGER